MKRFFTLLFAAGIFSPAFSSTFYDQLCAINAGWKQHSFIVPAGPSRVFASETEYIRTHLLEVETLLRKKNGAHLSASQKENRSRLLDVLHDYALRGVFPVNYYKNFRTPVFIDEHNTHCAVGYLMEQSGHETLARRISANDNYVFVRNITDKELPAWQAWSGFSVDELALIQPAYQATPDMIEQPYACKTVYFGDMYAGYRGKGIQRPAGGANDSVWYSGACEGGVLHGKWVQYHSPGMLWVEGEFRDGKKHGTWTRYHSYRPKDKPLISSVEHWVNGKLHGLFESFDYSGALTQRGNYVDGKKDGEWKSWQSGRLLRKENYRDGKRDGELFQYYINWYDTTKKEEVAVHSTYKDGLLLHYRAYELNSNGRLKEEKKWMRENFYHAIQYNSAGAVSMKGTEMYHLQIDSLSNEMYYGLPKTYYEHDVFAKVGQWSLYAPAHYLVASRRDSAHFYFENDSIRIVTSYHFQGRSSDSTVFATPRAFAAGYYGYGRPDQSQESWSFSDGKMTIHSATWPDGRQKFSFGYRDGKLENGHTCNQNGEYIETWNISTEGNERHLWYQRFDAERRLLMKGRVQQDTATRYGRWEFYDKTGNVITKGDYVNGLKEGEWMETRPDGTIWEGNYKEGTKKGTWEQIYPKGEIIRREKF